MATEIDPAGVMLRGILNAVDFREARVLEDAGFPKIHCVENSAQHDASRIDLGCHEGHTTTSREKLRRVVRDRISCCRIVNGRRHPGNSPAGRRLARTDRHELPGLTVAQNPLRGTPAPPHRSEPRQMEKLLGIPSGGSKSSLWLGVGFRNRLSCAADVYAF